MKALIKVRGRMNPSYIVELPIGTPALLKVVYDYTSKEIQNRDGIPELLGKIELIDTTIPIIDLVGHAQTIESYIDFTDLNDLAGKMLAQVGHPELIEHVMLDSLEQGLTEVDHVRAFARNLGLANRTTHIVNSTQVKSYVTDVLRDSPNGISQTAFYLKELTQDDGDELHYIEQDGSYIIPMTQEHLAELVADIITQFREDLILESEANEKPLFPLPDPHPVPSQEHDIPLFPAFKLKM